MAAPHLVLQTVLSSSSGSALMSGAGRAVSRRHRRTILTALASLAAASGCGIEFASIAEIEQLRVIGVQKSAPYAQPGETVQLEMLYHDGASEEARDIEVMWISGCENPPADLFDFCFEFFGPALRVAEEGLTDIPGLDDDASLNDLFRLGVEEGLASVDLGSGATAGFQREFEVTVPEDLITRRPPPPDPMMPSYGLQYIFFAVCAGELQLDLESETFPIQCVDEDGEPLRGSDFVAGYSAVFAYDELTNDNPEIIGIEVGEVELDRDQFCIGSECGVIDPDPDRECNDDDPVISACEDEDSDDCPELPMQVIVDEDSVNTDAVLSITRGSEVDEQMWVNYHADHGEFSFEVSLVNDATSGFNDDPETDFVAPEREGPVNVWTVVRDNRGGAEWARFQVCVE